MLVLLPNIASWPRLLGTFLALGNHPGMERARLISILELLHDLDLRVFGEKESRRAFDDMPAEMTVFRGTSAAETGAREWGLSWTVDRLHALKFSGSQYGLGVHLGVHMPRTSRDPGMMLLAEIRKESIAAVARWEGEHEILICPRDIDPLVRWISFDEAYRIEAQAIDDAERSAIEALRR